MPQSPVGLALGSAILLTTAVLAASSPAAAETAPQEPPPSPDDVQLHALERDLGLSSTEATEALTRSSEAATLEAELRDSLGSSFGGAVFDLETGELTAHVTDAEAAEEARAAGARTEIVTHGADNLDQIVADLDAAAAQADTDITGWYPDLERDSVVIEVLDGSTAAAEELTTTAGVDGSAVEVEERTARYSTLEEIIGGEGYTAAIGRCSVGFAVSGGFATAGHCGGTGTTTESPDGTVAGSVFPGGDGAWVSTDWTPTPFVTRWQENGQATVTGSQQAGIGSAVCRSGSTTGYHCGTIEATNQTVQYPEGTVTGLTRTSACAEPGDSGGPFISGPQNASQAQGVTSGGTGSCRGDGNTFFQPIEPILAMWELTLTIG